MKRRFFTALLTLLMLLSMALPMALASETTEATEETEETTDETTEETRTRYSTETSGSCGKDVTWRLEDETLIITGSGKIDAGSPWEFYKDTIEVLILDGDITHIGDEAFYSCNNLRYIDFGDSLVEIGYQAFYSCNSIEAIRLPATFRKFGQECFRDCKGLEVIYCDGPMPSFKANCLYTDHTVIVYYSRQTPWPQEETSRLMSNFGSRVYVDMGDPSVLEDYYDEDDFPDVQTAAVPEETQPAETAAPTVPETTAPVVTEPATVPTTAPTVPATEPATQPEFQLESEPLFVTEPEEVREAPAQEEPAATSGSGFSGWVWVLIAAAALTGILVLALVIRMVVHSAGRYED